ncbi:MAG: phosphate/phosphite/phosphonate ABC transporter substrate-binding protein [Deltaproteobacteria bacterium]|nr:phosphate/phosphite/phosphonate ABC transporter substrate-binding protein [Deltaproteobacteria bacterium]MBI3065295.1 phosphate/phosphite/phosphonate ABC transporter substrate-binding protein [Deltaproteobacteria bacterium]
MKKEPRCFLWICAGVVLFLSVALTGNAAEKAPQPLNVKSLAMGLVFQKPQEPVPEPLREFVGYVARKLSSTPAISGTVVVAPSASQLVNLLEEKRLDFYMESPYPTYLINRNGSARLLLRRWKGGIGEYRSIIFTSKESGISRVEELRGKMIVFEDAGSTSGYFMPKLLMLNKRLTLTEKPGLDAKVAAKEIGYIFAASDKNILNLVLAKKVAAGAFSNDDYAGVGEKEKSAIAILEETASLPRHLVSVRKDLPQPVAKRLKEILLAMHEDGEGRAILQRTDNTTKFDLLPGGEEMMRKKLIELFRPRGKK